MKEDLNMITVLKDAFLSLDSKCLDNKVEPDFSKWKFKMSNYIMIDSNKLLELKIDQTSIASWKDNDNIFISYSLGWVPTIQGKIALLNYKDNISLTSEQCNTLGYMVTYSKLNVNTLEAERYKLCNFKTDGTLIGCNSEHIIDNVATSSNTFLVWGATEALKYIYGKIAVCHEQNKYFF